MATGIVGLAWGDFALQWEPVPASFPARTALAYLFAVLLVLGGAGINVPRWAAAGALLLSVLYAVVVVIMHGADVLQHPGVFVSWSGLAEQLALLAAGVAAYSYSKGAAGGTLPTDHPLAADRPTGANRPPATDRALGADRLLRAAVLAMGICLVIFG